MKKGKLFIIPFLAMAIGTLSSCTKDDISALQEKDNDLQSQIDDLKNEVASLKSQITDLKTEMAAKIQEAKDDYGAKISDLQSQIDADKNALATLTSTYNTEKAALEAALRAEIKAVDDKYAPEIAALKAKDVELQAAIDALDDSSGAEATGLQNQITANKNKIETPISIDTRSAKVTQECIKLGASIINDVSGLDYDKNMVEIISKNPQIKIIIQHSLGTPENMQNSPHYENLMDDIFKNLNAKVNYAIENGIKKDNIIIDPGIGFGKTKEHNFEILKRWKELQTIGCPILIGLSRKSILDMQNTQNEEKDIFTLALNSILINENIDYIRVHNVKIHKKLQELI